MPVRLYRKILLIMRLTTVILIATLMQVSAATFGQSITINERKASFEQVLKSIRSQSGYDVIMDRNILKKAGQVNMSVKDATIDEAMKSLLSGLPLKYTIDGKIIVIEEKSGSFIDRVIARFQAIDVRGKVVDSLGNGLPGATVSVKNGKGSTSTDAGGNFYLKNVDEGAVLVVNYLGYVNREITASKEFMNVVLEQSESKLDEVQIQAYGVTSRRLSTGNISSVKAEDIAKQSVTNPLLALAGRVPGLEITQNTGLPGSGLKIRIQGTNSLAGSNEPFYVIDGVPYPSVQLATRGLAGMVVNESGAIGNPLSYINPQDIESIDVLKDASATAIYGSRAQNGAILITTKKGTAGQLKVDLNLQTGFGEVANKLHLLNTKQYVALRKEAFANEGVDFVNTFPFGSEQYKQFYATDLLGWDTTRFTDWQDVLIGNASGYQNAQLSILGGGENIRYLVSGNYHKETTVFPGSQNDKKGSLHFSLNSASKNNKLNVSFSGSYLADDSNLSGKDLTSSAVTLPPNSPKLYNDDGTLNWEILTIPGINFSYPSFTDNPLAAYTKGYRNQTNNFLSSSNITYEVLSNLRLKLSFGFNRLEANEFDSNPSTTVDPSTASNPAAFVRTASYVNSDINTWNIEPQVSFNRIVRKGKLESLIGTSIQRINSKRYGFNGTGYNNDIVMESPSAANTLTASHDLLSEYKYFAVFGRVNYTLSEKYIFEITGRRDGSSRFGENNKFHNFGAIGSAWVFSNETFSKHFFPFLSFGKMRASYGTTGNDQIGDYAYISQYLSLNPETPYAEGGGKYPAGLANPFIQWEETRKLSLGLDLGFFNDRLLLNTTLFRNRSSNQLVGYKLPSSTGFTSIISNFPALIQNSGIEISLNTVNIQRGDFRWITGLNITVPKNKLVEFPNLSESSYANELIIGQPISYVKLYDFVGVDPSTGIYKYRDRNGNLTSRPDQGQYNNYLRLNTGQFLFGGVSNSFSYKGFSFDFLFQFVKQNGPDYFYGTASQGNELKNEPASVLDHWRTPGDVKSVGQFTFNNSTILNSGTTRLRNSDAVWGDASFVRLKNVSLSWQIPDSWKEKVRLQNARLFVQGQNLLTVTNYIGLDPESKSSTVLPPLRVITFGIQTTF